MYGVVPRMFSTPGETHECPILPTSLLVEMDAMLVVSGTCWTLQPHCKVCQLWMNVEAQIGRMDPSIISTAFLKMSGDQSLWLRELHSTAQDNSHSGWNAFDRFNKEIFTRQGELVWRLICFEESALQVTSFTQLCMHDFNRVFFYRLMLQIEE